MKTILIIYLISFILVSGIFLLDKIVSDEPKGKFGKWWRKNIVDKNETYD